MFWRIKTRFVGRQSFARVDRQYTLYKGPS